MDKDTKIKKIDSNKFDLTESNTRRIDKKVLKTEIADIKEMIQKKKEAVGLIDLEKDLKEKEELLASLK